nr:hypothetical protein [Tanacetum cinerariifolium]
KFNRFSFLETPKVLLLDWDRISKIKNTFGNKQYKPEDVQELFHKLFNDVQNIHEELVEYINSPSWNCPAFSSHDDNDDDEDYTIAITPEEPDNFLSIRDEHLDTIPATKSNKVIKFSVENLVPILNHVLKPSSPSPILVEDSDSFLEKSDTSLSYSNNSLPKYETLSIIRKRRIVVVPQLMLITLFPIVSLEVAEIVTPKVEEIEDDNLREKMLNVHLLIANIEALKDNPTPSSELLTKSSSTSLKSFLEETNTFHNSLPEFENFYFDLGEISSGSTTTHSDISLSEYDSFIFDFANEEFVDKLAHIISPPEYDRFYFWDLPDLGELMFVLNSRIRENLPSATSVNLPIGDDYSPLLAYVVWIFIAYLTYPVIPPYLHPFGNEDTIFDPGITINRVYSFKP